jgi:methionine synthase II (cobalamin-independent)
LQVAAGLSTVAIARMQNHTLEQDSAQALHDAAAELQDAWAALIHPDAYFVHIPEALKQRWLDLDLLVQPELSRFNAAIQEYNQAITQYPAAVIASLFQFRVATVL